MTIQEERWVSSLSDKMTEISDKVSKAKATSKTRPFSKSSIKPRQYAGVTFQSKGTI